jgi:hypothetical protein
LFLRVEVEVRGKLVSDQRRSSLVGKSSRHSFLLSLAAPPAVPRPPSAAAGARLEPLKLFVLKPLILTLLEEPSGGFASRAIAAAAAGATCAMVANSETGAVSSTPRSKSASNACISGVSWMRSGSAALESARRVKLAATTRTSRMRIMRFGIAASVANPSLYQLHRLVNMSVRSRIFCWKGASRSRRKLPFWPPIPAAAARRRPLFVAPIFVSASNARSADFRPSLYCSSAPANLNRHRLHHGRDCVPSWSLLPTAGTLLAWRWLSEQATPSDRPAL